MNEFQMRRARAQDAAEISAVLIRSITDLCRDDHLDDPRHIDGWTANKSPSHVLRWMEGDSCLLVSEADDGKIAGIGQYSPSGEILLLYVAPEFQGKGHSSALLSAMETALAKLGISTATLVSSRTAQAFYQKRGWQIEGPQVVCYTTDGQPMRKVLNASS